MTIVEMLERNAEIFPEKTAIIYGDLSISYREFHERSKTLANVLISMGLRKGDRVGIVLQKTPEVLISFLGVACAGGIVFPVDFNQTHENIEYLLKQTDPTMMIVDGQFQNLISQFKEHCSEKKIIVVGQTMANQLLSWEDVFA